MKTADSMPDDRLGFSTRRFAFVAVVLAVSAGCAAPGENFFPAERNAAVYACPVGTVRTCDIVGGNKFQKRYGRCYCTRR